VLSEYSCYTVSSTWGLQVTAVVFVMLDKYLYLLTNKCTSIITIVISLCISVGSSDSNFDSLFVVARQYQYQCAVSQRLLTECQQWMGFKQSQVHSGVTNECMYCR